MRFTHATIVVSDFERSKAFYLALGLTQIVDSPPRYARFQLPDGDATLSIEVTGKAPVTGGVQLFIECDDLDERVEALKARGIAFSQEPLDMPYLWREARLREPDGHDVRLFRAGVNRLDPPWKIEAPAATRANS